ncbi:MAG: AzlC family ABC transporter permease [Solobacterium sp.]|nr:AzlC family ABC transporter permease [Solobacterium sp.]
MSTLRQETANAPESSRQWFVQGMKDAVPVGLGYFAVSFALGITMKNAGLLPLQGFLISLLNNASAGEYAGTAMIAAAASYLETALMVLAANARYTLMSTAFSQKFSEKTAMIHRWIIGFVLTDELFALGVRQKGYLVPAYYYGMMSVAMPGWAFGTMFGILFGALLPSRIVSALSVALFAMFLAVIIPPARHNPVIRNVVLAGFALSFLSTVLPGIRALSEGVRMIGLTVGIAAAAAFLHPVKEEEQ